MEKGGAQQCDQQSTGPRNPPNHRLSPPLSIRRHGCSRRATRWEPAVGTWRASAWSTRPGNPATAREKYWAAHEKITVRRNTLSRAAAMIDEAAAEEARDREVRRPRGEVQRLEEEKRDLERRLATVERELEKARAKMPRGNATS